MSAHEKNALHPSEHSYIPVLVPNLQEGHLIQSLSNKSRFSAAAASSFPWYSRELILVPEARSGSYTLSYTLAGAKTPHCSFSGLHLCLDLLAQAC